MCITIDVVEDSLCGTVSAKINNQVIGRLLYNKLENTLIIKSTSIESVYMSKRIGSLLFYMLIERARLEKYKVVPHCMFAIEKFRKDASLKDVWFNKN